MSHRCVVWNMAVLISFAVPAASVLADDAAAPKRIDAENALAHAGEQVIVTMTVNASRLLRDSSIGFLNSVKDYRDKDNFTVVMYEGVLEQFAAEQIDDPCKHFRGKTIEVTGGIELRNGKPQIVLKSPKDIKVIEADAKESRDAA